MCGELISNLVSRIRAEVARALHSLPARAGAPSYRPPRASAETQGVVLAVSGGADSLCLADAVLALAAEHALRPIIAHLDHGLRSEAARADAEFVRAFAHERQVPCVIERADVAAAAQARKQSLEVAGRELRYRFLARVANENRADLVALAHHADDQAETVLLRLLRGTGLSGLRGMQLRSPLPTAPHLTAVRPLLRITRAEIEQYCRERGLEPRRDASNDELDYARNRIRHELLPMLERYNPNIRSVLTRLADTVATDLEIIEQATHDAFARVARPIAHRDTSGIEVDRDAWRAFSPGLQRATLREAVRRLQGDVTNLKYAAIEEARDVLNSDAGSGEIAITHDLRITVTRSAFVLHERSSAVINEPR